jgi:long-chain acyl-CoA synthetase
MSRLFSVPVPFTEGPGYTATRRSAEGHNPSLSCDGATTLFEAFQHGVSLSPNGPCLGFRPINERSGAAGAYEWLTYSQVNERAVALGAGLVHLGACPPNEDGLCVLGFFAKNRLEWVVGEQACYRHNIIPVPLYDGE